MLDILVANFIDEAGVRAQIGQCSGAKSSRHCDNTTLSSS
jgi:hypothetical protein